MMYWNLMCTSIQYVIFVKLMDRHKKCYTKFPFEFNGVFSFASARYLFCLSLFFFLLCFRSYIHEAFVEGWFVGVGKEKENKSYFVFLTNTYLPSNHIVLE